MESNNYTIVWSAKLLSTRPNELLRFVVEINGPR